MRVHVKFRTAIGTESKCAICESEISAEELCHSLEVTNACKIICDACYQKSKWIQDGGRKAHFDDDWGFCPVPERREYRERDYVSRYLTDNVPRDDIVGSYVRDFLSRRPHQLNLLTSAPRVYVAHISQDILKRLQMDYDCIYELSPEQFELLICDRLEAMGMQVIRVTSNVYIPDGGVDIIAYHRQAPFPALIAVQAKHHRSPTIPVGVKDVRELKSIVVGGQVFNAGLLVTNTSFSSESEWTVKHIPSLLRLRGKVHLHQWLADNFRSERVINEFPEQISLASGLVIPRSKLKPVHGG